MPEIPSDSNTTGRPADFVNNNAGGSAQAAYKPGNDEIDLLAPLLGFLRFLYQSRWWMAAATIIAIAGSILYYKRTPPVFKSRMTCESSHFADGRVIDLVQDLQAMIDIGDTVQVKKLMNLPVKDIKQIVNLQALSFAMIEQESKKDKDAIHESVSGTFGVEALVKDLKVLPKVQYGLIHYLSENDFSRKRMEADTVTILKVINSMKREEIRYDSLNKTYYNHIMETGKGVMMTTNPFHYEIELQALYERRMELEKSLRLHTEIRIIQNFAAIKKPVSPRLGSSLLSSLVILNLLALALRGTIIIVRKLKPLLTEQHA
ncbi:MAG: hypothetical protein V4543_07155 [Bacteroidota bacterium]